MSPVTPPAKVLVSGANGYIAAWVVRSLLEKGYAVRGTVRSASKGAHLQSLFASHGDKFEVVIVDDITKDGAFDEAVKGVDLVEHTASPFHFKVKQPEELIVPAVHGTVGILESVKKYGTSVKRVVITGSTASVLRPADGPITFSEADWNESAIAEVKEKGSAALPMIIYRASKTLAEKSAWEFYEKHKASVGWDLVVLNPPFVFGPPIHEVRALTELNTSMQDMYDTTVLGKRDAAGLAFGSAWIDVRDLGSAHVLAAEKAAAGGERIIVSAGGFFWQEIVDVANSITPAPLPGLAVGTPGSWKDTPRPITFVTDKADRILGLKYRSLETMVQDSLDEFAAFKNT
ncbi:D-lactaldehyde dehydrogenase [Auriscalpium vulgare]|uniref:D-lactaldehyde dehydrogenase n=1 Tax=Auriscalpium vulgare TaxID=40419 RepID=A0ACB8S6C0_9AGAM|nr:D-lactaldehyde dehydrogenase [Auriscalpium vulgare]